jgi:hypothetical protein
LGLGDIIVSDFRARLKAYERDQVLQSLLEVLREP